MIRPSTLRAFLARRWFFLALLVGVGLTLLWTEPVGGVVNLVPPRAAVALILFLMAWSLETRRLVSAMLRPAPAFGAMVITFGLLPALGWLAGLLFPDADYRIGLAVCTSVPCTFAAAIIWTRLAGGDEATALLITLLTAGTSWLVTTSWLTLTTGAQVTLDVPEMMRTLAITLIVPVSLGQLARWPARLRELATRGRTVLSVGSRLLILTVILQAVALAAASLPASSVVEELPWLLLLACVCLGLHLTALCVGYWGGGLLRWERSSRIAVALAGSQKTLPVGLLLINTYYRDYPLAVIPMLFYHVGQLLLDTLVADFFRRTEGTAAVKCSADKVEK